MAEVSKQVEKGCFAVLDKTGTTVEDALEGGVGPVHGAGCN